MVLVGTDVKGESFCSPTWYDFHTGWQKYWCFHLSLHSYDWSVMLLLRLWGKSQCDPPVIAYPSPNGYWKMKAKEDAFLWFYIAFYPSLFHSIIKKVTTFKRAFETANFRLFCEKWHMVVLPHLIKSYQHHRVHSSSNTRASKKSWMMQLVNLKHYWKTYWIEKCCKFKRLHSITRRRLQAANGRVIAIIITMS